MAAGIDCWHAARIFEIKLLNLSGFKPRLDACVHCQKENIAQGKFSSVLGGILCPRCNAADQNAKKVFPGTLASIVYIEKTNWEKALQLKLSSNIAKELEEIMHSFLEVHLDKKSKARKFLN